MSDLIKYEPAPPQDIPAELFSGARPDDMVDVAEIISVIKDNWILGAAVGGGIFLLVLMFFLQMTPTYTARAVVVLETRDQEIVDVDNVLSGLQESADVVETEVKIIRSANITSQVVSTLGLGVGDEFASDDRYVSASEAAGESLSDDEKARRNLEARKRQEAVIRRVQDDLAVYRDGDAYALNIEFSSPYPERAAQIANAFADTYVKSQADDKRMATLRANDLLRVQLETLAVAVEESEAAVEAYRSEAGLLDTDGSTLIEQQTAALAQELATLENEMAGHLAKLKTLKALEDGGQSAETMSDMVSSPVMSELRTQEAAVEREFADATARYGPRHPTRVAAQKRLESIRAEIAAEVGRQSTSIRLDAETSRQRVAFIESRSAELREALSDTRRAEVRLRELERQAETDRELYESFLARFKETAAQQDLQQGDARVISPAGIPTSPSWPRRSMTLLTAGTLGMGAGMLSILVASLLSSGFRTPRDLERATGYPCIATLPHIGRTRLGVPQTKAYRQSQYMENVKAIYSDVMSRMTTHETSSLVVAIVSSMPGEAKTSTVISLAQSAAERGVRTLCIDGDGRRRRLSAKFLKSTDQLSDQILSVHGGTAIYARQSDQQNLSVLLAEDLFAGRGELNSERCEQILDDARKKYDLIIFDTPPLLALVDARWIAAQADISYLAVRWQKTPRQALGESLTLAKRAGADIGGTILTRVAANRAGVYTPYYDAKMSKQLQAYFEDANQRTRTLVRPSE